MRAYNRTYGLPVKVTNCSNNYGPYQFPEKLIPLTILNALEGKPIPVYGKGQNVRDWLYVEDHCEAIWAVIHQGEIGHTYNISGNEERKNLDVVYEICHILAEELKKPKAEFEKFIKFVADRPGHDLRYALDSSKIRQKLGWKPKETFKSGLRKTVKWYLTNSEWVSAVKTGEYMKWIERNYEGRL